MEGQSSLGPTARLASWVSGVSLSDIPEDIRTRAKYLILDGLACGLFGAHLPASEKAVRSLFELESPTGQSSVWGWADVGKLSPLSAALLNSSFIQGFELDDWHSDAPLHSNSIILPALFAAAQSQARSDESATPISGSDLLLATIVGYEVGPRVGQALHGAHVLTTGWHSGAVFGPSAAAAAVGKLLGLNATQIEDAFGIACTQACGLMSAQFGSDAKRMQHGFASRNGLLAASLARSGYTGIKAVFETEYGGFLKQFSLGNGRSPPYLVDQLTAEVGVAWRTQGIRVKPYASMAGTHSTVDCIRRLQELHPTKMREEVGEVKSIKITMSEAVFHHGGWTASRPLTSTGAQMSNAFVAATQIVHGQVLPAQFAHSKLDNDDVWKLINVTTCELNPDRSAPLLKQSVVVEFNDGTVLEERVDSARGVAPALTNEEIVEKWRMLTKDVVEPDRVEKIERTVLALEECGNVALLQDLLGGSTKNPLA
ncbi:hypothetical protein F5Y19DRAFT_190214 [Xylariaceae sp. FL1651]|nr:hypothetical protein F5Y19DRAFT_190214 [Xylariaceae sp. FL1651]